MTLDAGVIIEGKGLSAERALTIGQTLNATINVTLDASDIT